MHCSSMHGCEHPKGGAAVWHFPSCSTAGVVLLLTAAHTALLVWHCLWTAYFQAYCCCSTAADPPDTDAMMGMYLEAYVGSSRDSERPARANKDMEQANRSNALCQQRQGAHVDVK